jgi:hypothetical protein
MGWLIADLNDNKLLLNIGVNPLNLRHPCSKY